ncbi:50S ribosomal protein L17 [bacterium]|nr:50S ribosomal protein L17 [bacterium]
MRHRYGNKKLGKPTDQRIALLRSLVRSLFLHGKIKTTDTRAKEARRMAESLITLGKDGSLHARRQALKVLSDPTVIKFVFDVVVPQFKERNGGYTRVTKVGIRRGDAAVVSQLELVG